MSEPKIDPIAAIEEALTYAADDRWEELATGSAEMTRIDQEMMRELRSLARIGLMAVVALKLQHASQDQTK